MSYSAEQITEKGHQPRYSRKGKAAKFQKKSRHRKLRQQMKDQNFIPQYNRFNGWFD